MPKLKPLAKALQEIPLGVSEWGDFADVHSDYVFVDKTAKLADLVRKKKVFIARPRRMGKTTLCSMLEELFSNGKEGFKGKAVYDQWTETEVYPVIRLSFHSIAGTDVSKFECALRENLVSAFSRAGFPEVKNFQQSVTLSGFLSQFYDIAKHHLLVFIIDEWDYPLSNCLDNEENFNVVKEVLKDFYSWLRVLPPVRFILITGIMRYREINLFSGQDIQDLSLAPRFADLLGYTQKEVQTVFAGYIARAAKKLKITKTQLLEQLKQHYDGFCFDENAKVSVYCPYSINQFFDQLNDPDKQLIFENFWMISATANSAFISFLRGHALDQKDLSQICLQHFSLSKEALSEPFFFGTVKFKQLLVQGGYFSIKSAVYDPVANKTVLDCGVTNQEVAAEFKDLVLGYLVNFDEDKKQELMSEGYEAQKSLLAGDIECMCIRLNQILCKIHHGILKNAEEELYRSFLARFLSANLIDISEENANNLGRCDLVAKTADRIYDMELKRLSADKDTDADKFAMLNVGEAQLVARGYGSNLYSLYDPFKPQTGVILVISDKYQQICAWRTLSQTEEGIQRQEGLIPPLSVLTQLQIQYGRVHLPPQLQAQSQVQP